MRRGSAYFEIDAYGSGGGFGVKLVVAVANEYCERSVEDENKRVQESSHKLIFLRLKVRSLKSLALVTTRRMP